MATKYEKFADGDIEAGIAANGFESSKRSSIPKFEGEQVNLRVTSEPHLETQTSRALRTNSEALDNAITAVGSLESSLESNGSKTEYNSFPSYATSPDELSSQEKLRNFIEHLFFRFFSLIIILIDCTVLVIDISTEKEPHEQSVFDFFAIVFVLYFCIELSVRIYAQGVGPFFSYWYNTLDCGIIVISLLVTLIYFAIDQISGLVKLVVFGRLIRVIVLIRLVRIVYTEPRNLQKGVRRVVSENKRRLRDGEFDLDMTYITNNVIGMSFPSSGKMALYRNNIRDVAKYLDTAHGPGSYKVYNLCSEKSYDGSYFHDSVARYSIDDHNVPTLEQMLEFAKDVKDFIEAKDKNVIAVHCKGGKGRTGTMICAWLIYNGQFNDSKDVLEYFGEQRTDKTIGTKYQGVETPSQSRYVEYFNKVVNDFGGVIPPKKPLLLKKITISSLIGVGVGDGSDLTCQVYIDRESMFTLDFGSQLNCQTNYQPEADILTIIPTNCPTLIGNVRLKFNCKTKGVPRTYEDCAFFLWFNTAFVDMTAANLKIPRDELDNPHKSKTWKIYREKFAVHLHFSEVSS